VSVRETNRPEDRTTVLQSKLYRAAVDNRARRFHALYDKLYLPYVLQRAWELVKRNRGAGGIDGQTLAGIEAYGEERFLEETAQAVREQTYRPVPVRRVHIPKRDGSTRPLGIPTVRDRVVQAAAKLILEPMHQRRTSLRGGLRRMLLRIPAGERASGGAGRSRAAGAPGLPLGSGR